MFEHWLEDQNEQSELLKNVSLLIGSFINPEAVKKIVGGMKVESNDKDFEEVSKSILSQPNQLQDTGKKKRKRKKRIQ